MRVRSLAMAITATVATVMACGSTAAGIASASARAVKAPAAAHLPSAPYRDAAKGVNEPAGEAISPNGRTVFVTGTSGLGTHSDYATVAYSAATGKQLWSRLYSGSVRGLDGASAVAASPSGSAVFVTGAIQGRKTGYEYATIAYSAGTGKRLWVRLYNGAGGGDDVAYSMAVSPAGTSVFVTGASGSDYATIAYTAAGKQLWARRYSSAAGYSVANSLAVSRSGATVFVTGQSEGRKTGPDYATVAYSAATGRQLWVRRHNGFGDNPDIAYSVAVSPTGTSVLVTGQSWSGLTTSVYATIAYSATTGRQLWIRRYSNLGGGAYSVAVNQAGTSVFVTGENETDALTFEYVTIAYSAATGRQLWAKSYSTPGDTAEEAGQTAISVARNTVYVTGGNGPNAGSAYATVAYSAATGRQLWVKLGPVGEAAASSVAVNHDGTRVYVTGTTDILQISGKFATIAYSAATGRQLWLRFY
jgi:hypothetical protein